MKKKLVIFALMIIGLLISFMNVQKGNGVYAETEDKLLTTITPTKAKKAYDDAGAIKVLIENQSGSYSDYSGVYIYLGNKTENMAFKFQVDISADSNISVNHKLTPNKLYTLDDMNSEKCNAIIGETEYNYKSASIMLISDENGYISYSAMVELENNNLYNLVEADPVSGEWAIEQYEEHITPNNQGSFSLTDTETNSKFEITINDYDSNKASYDLSEIYYFFSYCKIGARSWDYKTLTFTRNVDDDGFVHVVVAVVTEHGDTLSLVYNQPNPDLIAAQAVIEKIDALPEVSKITLDDKNAVETARAAYNALTANQKAKVSSDTVNKLSNAEAKLAELQSPTPVKQGLSAGAIVGIVIGSILVVTIIGCLVLFILNKKGIINIPFLNKKEQKVDDSDTNKDK